MAAVSCKLFSLLCFLHILAIAYQASAQNKFLDYFCGNGTGNYTANSTYQNNLNTLLSDLSSNTEIDYGFYNFTYGQNADKVNAIGLCRGDVIKPEDCRKCLNDSRVLLTRLCPNQKEAIGWYDNCMLRYSNRSIFGVMETTPLFYMWNLNNATEVDQFNQAVTSLMDSLRDTAASGDSRRKFAAAKGTGPSFQDIYGLVQCTPDLSTQECSECLDFAIAQLPKCCNGKRGGRVIQPSCQFRYEKDYQFYNRSGIPSPPPQQPTAPPQTSSTNNTSSEGNSNTIIIVIAVAVPVLLFWCCV